MTWPAKMLLPVRLTAPPEELTLLADTEPAPLITIAALLACACVMVRLPLVLSRYTPPAPEVADTVLALVFRARDAAPMPPFCADSVSVLVAIEVASSPSSRMLPIPEVSDEDAPALMAPRVKWPPAHTDSAPVVSIERRARLPALVRYTPPLPLAAVSVLVCVYSATADEPMAPLLPVLPAALSAMLPAVIRSRLLRARMSPAVDVSASAPVPSAMLPVLIVRSPVNEKFRPAWLTVFSW
ncbi:hypothetical protein D3C73_833000 [compost metagenome]